MFTQSTPTRTPRITITDLPREVIRLIALKIYDPLELTQQDRLTWGIFSTVDMHQERQDDLASLISFSVVCRKIRREVRRILFTCVRVSGVHWAQEVIDNRDGWARYVKSIIIDLSMFDSDPEASTRSRLSPVDPNPLNLIDPFAPPAPPPSTTTTTSTNAISPTTTAAVISNTTATAAALKPRTCWAESSLLISLLNSLPSLNHLSFFADASDDSTLSLLFASLIPHPSLHDIPPTVVSNSPSALSTISNSGSYRHINEYGNANSNGIYQPYPQYQSHQRQHQTYNTYVPLTHRLKSFGWRQRAAPPSNFRQFSQTSTFVSTLHLIRHSYNLSLLVLDADLDEMNLTDILSPLKELNLRKPPIGEKNNLVSLMLCGPIKNWENDFLGCLVNAFNGIKELFIDRPLKKSTQVKETSFEDFTNLLSPLSSLPYLRLLQVGSYTFTTALQSSIVKQLARSIPTLIVVGLLGEEGETIWWGIWRRASFRGLGSGSAPKLRSNIVREGGGEGDDEGEYDESQDIRIKFLGDGDLRILEDENEDWIRKSQPPTPPLSTHNVESQDQQIQLEHDRDIGNEDIRMTPRYTHSPLFDPTQYAQQQHQGQNPYERNYSLGLTLDGNTTHNTFGNGGGGRPEPGQFGYDGNEHSSISSRGVSDGQGRKVMSLDRLMD